jgi:hypothetical protein
VVVHEVSTDTSYNKALCCWNKGLRTVTQRRWNQVYFAPLTRGTFQASQGSQYPLENVRDPGSSPPLLLPASQSHLCDQTMVMAHLCAMKERSMKATCPASPGQTPKRHTSLPLTLGNVTWPQPAARGAGKCHLWLDGHDPSYSPFTVEEGKIDVGSN